MIILYIHYITLNGHAIIQSMNTLYILIQQYLASLAPECNGKNAAETFDRYSSFLEETQRIAAYTNISDMDNSDIIYDDAVAFLVQEIPVAKQAALDWVTLLWAYAALHYGWTTSPLAKLPENIPRNELERNLAILDLIQEAGKTPAELAKQLLYEDAVIARDIYNMHHGKGFGILFWETDTDDGQKKYQFSGHPYLLAFNLPKIGELLADIRKAVQNNAPHSHSFRLMYKDLWFRLTPYGKEYMSQLGLLAPDNLSPAVSSDLEHKALQYGCDTRFVHALKTHSPVRLTLQRGPETEDDTVLVLDLVLSERRRLIKLLSTITDQEYLVSFENIIDAQFDLS